MQDSLAAAVCIKVFAMGSGVRLQTWLDSGTKERFSAVARHEGLSDSAMLKRLVDLMLQTANAGQAGLTARDRDAQLPANRVSVRLRPDDVRLLQERAMARGMRPATYLSVQARAHLHHLAPLPREELLALKHTVSELSSIGRNLNQIARGANRGDRVAGLDRQGVAATFKVCSALRDHVKGLLAANLRSWEQGHGDAQ
ncbi:MAG: hypothetical protein QM718_10845 [Steroidobacteraceae bacterium]